MTVTKPVSKAVVTKMAVTGVSSTTTAVKRSAAVTAVKSSPAKSAPSLPPKSIIVKPVATRRTPADTITSSKPVGKASTSSPASATKVAPTSTVAARAATPSSATAKAKMAATPTAKGAAAAKNARVTKIVSTPTKSSKPFEPSSKSTAENVLQKLPTKAPVTGAPSSPSKLNPVAGKTAAQISAVGSPIRAPPAKRATPVSLPKTKEVKKAAAAAAAPTKKPATAVKTSFKAIVAPAAPKPVRSIRTPIASKSITKVCTEVQICDADSTNPTLSTDPEAEMYATVDVDAATEDTAATAAAAAALPGNISNFMEERVYEVAEQMVEVLGLAAVVAGTTVDEQSALLRQSVDADPSTFEPDVGTAPTDGAEAADDGHAVEQNVDVVGRIADVGSEAAESAQTRSGDNMRHVEYAGSGVDDLIRFDERVESADGQGRTDNAVLTATLPQIVATNKSEPTGNGLLVEIIEENGRVGDETSMDDLASEEMNENRIRTSTETIICDEQNDEIIEDTEENQSTDENIHPEMEQFENQNDVSYDKKEQAVNDEQNLNEEVHSAENTDDQAEDQLNVSQNNDGINDVDEELSVLVDINGENSTIESDEILKDQSSCEETSLVELEVCRDESLKETKIASDADIEISESINLMEVEDAVKKIKIRKNDFENDSAVVDSECSDDPCNRDGFVMIEFGEEYPSEPVDQTESCSLSIDEVSLAEIEKTAAKMENIALTDGASYADAVKQSYTNAAEILNDFEEKDGEKIMPEFEESSSFVACADEEASRGHVTNAKCILSMAVINEEKCTFEKVALSLEPKLVEQDKNVVCESEEILSELTVEAEKELDTYMEHQHNIDNEEFKKISKKRNKRRNKHNKKSFRTFKNESTDCEPFDEIQENYTDGYQSFNKRPNSSRSKYSKKKEYRRYSEPGVESNCYVAPVWKSFYGECF